MDYYFQKLHSGRFALTLKIGSNFHRIKLPAGIEQYNTVPSTLQTKYKTALAEAYSSNKTFEQIKNSFYYQIKREKIIKAKREKYKIDKKIKAKKQKKVKKQVDKLDNMFQPLAHCGKVYIRYKISRKYFYISTPYRGSLLENKDFADAIDKLIHFLKIACVKSKLDDKGLKDIAKEYIKKYFPIFV